jgi:hypothetical protein
MYYTINICVLFQNAQELVAEISGLERQRDELEAELKKVLDNLFKYAYASFAKL